MKTNVYQKVYSLNASSVTIPCSGSNRHDIINSGAGDITVNAVSPDGNIALLGTVTAGNVGSYSFYADQIQLVAAAVATGVSTSYGVYP